uniref:Lactamase_B domain-containing protein n=1 Tax=Haemonchus contortus TaxID=6289 RepID=A0A7I4Y3Z1_HAECO|nr:Beta-lactamase domain containing protein [Haemonchus contortus]
MPLEQPTVDQLIIGYARNVGDRLSATGSVTLVRSVNKNILIDCGDPWNGGEILRKLSSLGLGTDDIHVVVVTHGHIDHCGNLSLFKDATLFMGGDVASEGTYSTIPEDSSVTLAPNVELLRSRGHTDHDIIVVVNNTERGRIVISGDIFECANDDAMWKGVSRYPDLQEKSRSEIEDIAEWIVPGHGIMFKNPKNPNST